VSTSLRSRIRRACLVGCVSGAALLVFAVGGAAAATTTMVAVSSTFSGEAEGWKAAPNEGSGLLGLCIEGLTCPAVSNEFHATGGVENSGYIETKEGGLLSVGLLAESTGTWESPEFTFLGVAGQRPTKVEFTLARRAQLANLLGLPGAQANYTVELVDKTTPSGTVVVVNHAPLSGAEEWKTTSTALSPSVLEKGDAYKVRIRTSFVTPAAVVPAGGVGYDNVELTASRDEVEEGPKGSEGSEGPEGPKGPSGPEGPGGTNGSTGGTGSGGSNGSSGTSGINGSGGGTGGTGNGGSKGVEGAGGAPSVAELRNVLGAKGVAGTASLKGTRVILTGTCPKATHGACTVRIKGLLNKRKAATTSGRAKIAIGGRHRFSVALTPQALRKVRQQGRLLVKEWVRVGNARVIVYKKVKLVQR
jgi:hypothetical protein